MEMEKVVDLHAVKNGSGLDGLAALPGDIEKMNNVRSVVVVVVQETDDKVTFSNYYYGRRVSQFDVAGLLMHSAQFIGGGHTDIG
jgi:hypothetical protein